MKKFRLLAITAVASMLAFAPSTALAADESTVGVQLNGEDLVFDDAEPMLVGGRTYLPFRAIFENLGAEVSYDETAQSVTAVKEDTTVTLTIGESGMVVTKGEETETVDTDAASFVSESRTYVPVRFVAQALDCTVGWDDANKTAIIIENDLFSLEDVTFNTTNEYLKYAQKFSAGKYEVDGDFDFNMSMSSAILGTEKDLVVPGTLEMDGLLNGNKANLSANLKLTLTQLLDLLREMGGDVTEFSSLEDMSFDMIMDMDNGGFYMTSSLFAKAFGVEENTWIFIDYNELFDQMDMNLSDLMALSNETDMAKLIEAMLVEAPVNNKYATTAYIESFNLMIDLFADSSFTKKDGESMSSVEISEEGMTAKIVFTVTENSNHQVNGYKMLVKLGAAGLGDILTMNMSQKGLSSKMDMTMDVDGMMSVNVNGTIEYRNTTKVPISKPADGNIVNFMDLMNDMMAIETSVEESIPAEELTPALEVEAVTPVDEVNPAAE